MVDLGLTHVALPVSNLNDSIAFYTQYARMQVVHRRTVPTTGFEVALNLLPVFADQLTITGSIMGTLKDMENMMRLIALARIEPEIGVVLPMERAEEGFRAMWDGRTHGKTVFTR